MKLALRFVTEAGEIKIAFYFANPVNYINFASINMFKRWMITRTRNVSFG